MATDLIRMSALAGQHLEALQLELDKVAPFPGTDRAGVMRSRKSRVAVVGNEYVGPAPRPRIFDHYRTAFVAAGWRQCGHSVAHDNYCRGEYEAIVSVPSALGSGSYSVTLQWNRITWPVWLSAGALIFIACWSLAELTRRHAPVPRRGWRSSLKLHIALTPQECVRQMETAEGRDIVFHPGETIDDGSISRTSRCRDCRRHRIARARSYASRRAGHRRMDDGPHRRRHRRPDPHALDTSQGQARDHLVPHGDAPGRADRLGVECRPGWMRAIAHMKAASSRAMAAATVLGCLPRASSLR